MAQYLINVLTTFTKDFVVEADSKEAALKQAEIDFENLDNYGNILKTDFEVWEELGEKNERNN